jgi:hypothetical protein
MKRIFGLALLVCACACGLYAQVVDTTVCDVLKNPKSFDGKIVRIKGTAVAGFDQFVVKDTDCAYQVNEIWLSYPQGTKGKAGPAAVLELQPAHNFSGTYTAPTRTPVTLDKSKDFKQFDSLLSQIHQKGADMCLGCTRYEVSATFVGRLDGVAIAALQRDKDGKIVGFGGFGNMNSYAARLVLQSVSDVTPKEIDYSKTDAITKGDAAPSPPTGSMYDPIMAAEKTADALASSPAGAQAKKDVEVFGKLGEHTGANLLYGSGDEAAAKDEALGAKDSPDGIIYNCTFNSNRLEGDAMLRAIMHMGEHISELRTPMAGNEEAPPFVLEYNAWGMTAAAAIANGQRFLTLPGGYLLWNSKWPQADQIANMDQAVKNFLANEELLSK